MPRNAEKQHLVGTIAGLSHWHPDDPRIPALKAELATVRLAVHVAKEVQAWSLNPDQRARIVRAAYTGLNND